MTKRRKSTAFLVLSVFILSLVSVAGCGIGGLGGNGDTAWNYQQVIKSPIKATSSTSPVTMGQLENEKVQVQIPGNTFDKSTPITIVNPKKVPKVVGKEVTPLGSPVEITAGEEEGGTRLNEPVTITMKIDQAALKSKDPGQIYVTYFNGEQWDYIKPDKVDLEAGTLTFTTYHFCLFGYGEISVDERLKKWTQNEALTSWAHKEVNKKFDQAAEKIVEHILKEKLGVEEESYKAKIIKSMVNDGEWGDIRKNLEGAAENGLSSDQMTELSQKISLLAGKKIVDEVPEGKLKSALGEAIGDTALGATDAYSKALGAIAGGNDLEAGRIIGEYISDQFIATTAIKIAASAVQLQIDSWRNAEVEAAYQAYKNGSNSKTLFWGYKVGKGEFEDVWEQMKGVSRQLCIDAIKAQEQIRFEGHQPPLTDHEKDLIRASVKRDLEKQFKQRLKDDEAVAEEQAKLKELVDKYKESKMLEEGMFGYDKQYSVEQRLDILMHLKDKILQDTGRKGLTDGAFSTKANVSYADLVQLSQAWYTQPDGWQKYAQLIKQKFGIDLFPKPEEMNGTWNGSFTITKLDLPQDSQKSSQPKSTGDPMGDLAAGCEGMGPEILKALVNKPIPATYLLQLDKNGNGTLTMTLNLNNNGQAGQATALQCNYNSGKITATVSKQGASMKLEGKVGKTGQNDNGYVINGTGQANGSGMNMQSKWTCAKYPPVLPKEVTKPNTQKAGSTTAKK